MTNKGYKLSPRDMAAKEIELMKVNLDFLIGEYTCFFKEFVRYTNEEIAELIILNCGDVMNLEEDERNDVIAIMALFMKYGNAYVCDNEEYLEEIEKNVIDSEYAGVHYFFKEAIFGEKISEKDKKLIIRDVFDQKSNSAYVMASNSLFKLLEEKNQLYIQVVWYDLVQTAFNKYKSDLNKVNNKR